MGICTCNNKTIAIEYNHLNQKIAEPEYIDNMAGNLIQTVKKAFIMKGRIRTDRRFPGLFLQESEINRFPLDACRSSCLKSQQANSGLQKRRRQALCGKKAVRPCRIVGISHKNLTVKVGSGCNDHTSAIPFLIQPCHNR